MIYSRQQEARLRAAMDALLADLYTAHPGLQARVHVFGVTDYGPPGWLDPATSANLKLRVKEILRLQ